MSEVGHTRFLGLLYQSSCTSGSSVRCAAHNEVTGSRTKSCAKSIVFKNAPEIKQLVGGICFVGIGCNVKISATHNE